jgi:hypothetical protein
MVTFAPKRQCPRFGPIADFCVADADEVGQAVSAHVGKVDGLGAVREHQPRALFLVERLGDAAGGAEALLAQRGMPHERFVFGDQHVGMAVARRDRRASGSERSG